MAEQLEWFGGLVGADAVGVLVGSFGVCGADEAVARGEAVRLVVEDGLGLSLRLVTMRCRPDRPRR
jgi:hypothetical protein